MSFALTEAQFLDGSKDVTRRIGWWKLKAGDELIAVRKCMGLKAGQKQEVLGKLRLKSVRRERLDAVTADECRREGFPDLSPEEFIELFCKANSCRRDRNVARIEFERIE